MSSARERKLWDQITVRLTPEDFKLLRTICEARGETISTFARVAVLKRIAELGAMDPNRGKLLGALIEEGKVETRSSRGA